MFTVVNSSRPYPRQVVSSVSPASSGATSGASGAAQLGDGVHVMFPVLNSYSLTNLEQPSSSSSSFHSSYSGPNPFHLIRYCVLGLVFRPRRLNTLFLTTASTSYSASGSSTAFIMGGGGGAVRSKGSSSLGAGSKYTTEMTGQIFQVTGNLHYSGDLERSCSLLRYFRLDRRRQDISTF